MGWLKKIINKYIYGIEVNGLLNIKKKVWNVIKYANIIRRSKRYAYKVIILYISNT